MHHNGQSTRGRAVIRLLGPLSTYLLTLWDLSFCSCCCLSTRSHIRLLVRGSGDLRIMDSTSKWSLFNRGDAVTDLCSTPSLLFVSSFCAGFWADAAPCFGEGGLCLGERLEGARCAFTLFGLRRYSLGCCVDTWTRREFELLNVLPQCLHFHINKIGIRLTKYITFVYFGQ